MEKRVLLAAVLSGIIVILWFALVAPPRPAESPATVAGATPSPTAVEGAERPVPTVPEATVTPSGPVRAVLVGTDASDVTITGVGLRAVVSPRGGELRSLVLADYRDERGAPLELVRVGGAAPLTLGEAGPWNEELYQVEREGGTVRLSWSDGKGSWVEKRILAGDGKFALEVEVRSGGVAGRGGVVVATGVERGGEAQATGRFAGSDAVVHLNGKLERISATKLPSGKRLRGTVAFAGVEDQYFLLALLPSSGVDEVRLQGVPGKVPPLTLFRSPMTGVSLYLAVLPVVE
jgi:YidC/Oxa1 family membrane protein insertase